MKNKFATFYFDLFAFIRFDLLPFDLFRYVFFFFCFASLNLVLYIDLYNDNCFSKDYSNLKRIILPSCIHHSLLDFIDNMDHTFSGTAPSSVIFSQKCFQNKLKPKGIV